MAMNTVANKRGQRGNQDIPALCCHLTSIIAYKTPHHHAHCTLIDIVDYTAFALTLKTKLLWSNLFDVLGPEPAVGRLGLVFLTPRFASTMLSSEG